MQPFDLHPEFYNQSIWLSQEEKGNPLAVIKQFFDDVNLIEARRHLASLLEVSITTSNSLYIDFEERDAVLCFCRQLEKLVEAALLISTT